MNYQLNLPQEIAFARDLRKQQTTTEIAIWEKVRNRRLLGYKFLRQHPVIVNKYNGRTSFYIADFFCSEKKLVVELDGLIHTYQIDYDKARDIVMNELGLTVIRFTNEEVKKDIYEVLNRVKMHLR